MSREDTITNGTKIIFRDTEYMKAQLKIKLEDDNLTQSAFFKACIRAYVNDDPKFAEWVESFLEAEKKLKPHERKARKKLNKEQQAIVANFNLDDKELDGIYDILEEENPDL